MTSKNLKNLIQQYLLVNEKKLKINSKDIVKGDIFIALKGNKLHGNNFIHEALINGAIYIITDKKPVTFIKQKNILEIKNSLKFILNIAKKKRKLYQGNVIGITGSIGKTSLKENLNFFISKETTVSSSIKSYNNFLGVLVSVININLSSKFSIFEIGTNNFFEIRELTSIVMPNQVIITNINPTHLENLKNTRNIAIEKSDIFNPRYNKNIELLILPNSNIDEKYLNKIALKMRIPKIITFGHIKKSDYYIVQNNKKLTSKIIKKNKIIEINTKDKLDYQISNIAVCLIIFDYNNFNQNNFLKNIKKIKKIDGRGLIKNIILNNKKIIFIDESYNASPVSMENCLNYFHSMKLNNNQKKFLILGDMNELGKFSKKYHQNTIKQIMISNFDHVIVSGKIFKMAIDNMNIGKKNIRYLFDENQIMNYLKNNVNNNDTILIKCSNSTKVNSLANMLNNLRSK